MIGKNMKLNVTHLDKLRELVIAHGDYSSGGGGSLGGPMECYFCSLQ